MTISLAASVKSAAKLAAPVVLSRLSVLMIVTVDFIMTGQLTGAVPHLDSSLELAALGLGAAMQGTLLVIGIRFLQGTMVLASQAYGAGDLALCGAVWRQSFIHATILSIILFVLCQFGTSFFLLVGFDADLADGGGRVMEAFAWGVPAFYFYVIATQVLESLKRPLYGMVAVMIANVVNIGANWVLIPGNLGFPAMGAEGATLATSLIRIGVAIGIIACLMLQADAAQLGVRRLGPMDWALARKLRALGWPIAAAAFMENSATALLAMLAGYLSAAALGGYQVAMNVTTLGMMIAIALSAATTVQTGSAVGRQDQAGIAIAGWTGVGLGSLTLGVFAAIMMLLPETVAGLYTSDQAVRAITTLCLIIAGPALVAGGLQSIIGGALRGLGDVWIPAYLNIVSYWLIAVPISLVLTFVLDLGIGGLVGGLLIGAGTGAILLAIRFRIVSRRTIERL